MGLSIYNQKSNRWREAYNPLRGLTIPKLVSLQEAGERGEFADLQWLYHYMERTDAMIFSVLQRRRAALLDSEWEIRRVAPGVEHGSVGVSGYGAAGGESLWGSMWDAVLAQEQEAFLRGVYEGIDNFKEAIAFLFSGVFRGFAHLEKHYGPGGGIERLEPVEQWFWVRNGMFGDWEYNQDAVSGRRRGLEIERGDFVVFESVPLDRMLSVLYLRRTIGQTDWDSYMAVHGIPSIFLIGPPGVGPEKEEEYQRVVESILADGRGYLPHGSDIKTVSGGGGKLPFREHIEYLDRMVTLVGTGGLLTVLSETGSGTLAGSAHADTFQQIARGDAVTLSAVMQQELDGPLLAAAFPGWPALAYFEFAPSVSDQSSKVAQDAAQLAAAGFAVDPEEVSAKSGYRVQGGGL